MLLVIQTCLTLNATVIEKNNIANNKKIVDHFWILSRPLTAAA